MEALHGEAPPSPSKHARVEVFSAQLIGIHPRSYRNYRGAILLHSCDCYCAIFESSLLEPPLINLEGCITLSGPEHSIPVKDKIIICPWFIHVVFSHMNKEEAILWRAHSDGFNKLICRTIQVLNYYHLDINFAIYNDAVEAHLDVCLVDMEWGDADEPVHICGTVSCSNKVVPQSVANSVLFDRVSGDDVCIKPNKKLNESIALPLSRRMVVVPRTSPLRVHVCLAIGSKSEDASVAKGEVVFSARSNTEDDSIIIANRGKVSMKKRYIHVDWYRNLINGGYDLLGRTKDQIRTTEQVNAAMASCEALKLDGRVIIGGVTSNTDAAQLAETFAEHNCSTKHASNLKETNLW